MTQEWQSVVFVDLDDTLIHGPFEHAVWPVVIGELAGKSGRTTEFVRDLIVTENHARQQDPQVSPVAAMDWDDIVAAVAERLGVKLESNIEHLVRIHAGQSSVLDTGAAVLKDLAQPHRALVVSTKGLARYQKPVLEALGLLPLFNDLLTPDAHDALKRSKAFYGLWPAQTRLQMVVGDHYEDDIRAAHGFGFRTIWKPEKLNPLLRRKDPFARALLYDYASAQTVQPDAIIVSLTELPAVVRRIEHAALGFSDA